MAGEGQECRSSRTGLADGNPQVTACVGVGGTMEERSYEHFGLLNDLRAVPWPARCTVRVTRKSLAPCAPFASRLLRLASPVLVATLMPQMMSLSSLTAACGLPHSSTLRHSDPDV